MYFMRASWVDRHQGEPPQTTVTVWALFIGYLYLNPVVASKGARGVRQDQVKDNEHRCPAHGAWAEGRGTVVHHSGEEGTCGALYEDGATLLP